MTTALRVWTAGVDLPVLSLYDPASNSWVGLARPPRHHALGVMRVINGKTWSTWALRSRWRDRVSGRVTELR